MFCQDKQSKKIYNISEAKTVHEAKIRLDVYLKQQSKISDHLSCIVIKKQDPLKAWNDVMITEIWSCHEFDQ